MLDVNAFESVRIGLATAEDIRNWSHGEVKKPETINYRTLKPEKDGLFGEQIFGPTRDWECACGKYKRVRFKGIVCERCGVEVTRSRVRRERMGHIELAAPVTHIWFFKGVPSRLGYLLDISPKDLEKVIYFAAYMVTKVNEEQRHQDMSDLQDEFDVEIGNLAKARDLELDKRAKKLEEDVAEIEAEGAKSPAKTKLRNSAERDLKAIRQRYDDQIARKTAVWDRFKSLKAGEMEGDVDLWREMEDNYGDYFEGCMGAEAIKKRLIDFDLEAAAEELREIIETGTGQRKGRALKRLKVVNSFIQTGKSPAAMVLDTIPVIPPDLRPMVQLDGGRFATSDLNDLYRRVINRNNRLKRLIELGAPEIMLNNEKRMLQEAVDSLFDNGRRGRPVTGASNRPLKSLSDMLKGKQGRFRQNLLGKRVDYSGRSVIVVGPSLRMHQCGLPKSMALELFKPFVIKRLVDMQYAQNMKSAKRLVDRGDSAVWDVLEEVISEHPVLLNRAPTLHRLGIQAFEPVLVEGKAIHLPPLACSAFNADFDGDQMAVHLPLSAEAQAEARSLMMASDNILKPADGHAVTMPSQDMILGLFYLSTVKDGAKGQGRIFSSLAEARMALDRGDIDMQSKVLLRVDADFVLPKGWEPGEVTVVDEALPGHEAVVKEERFADGTTLFATSFGRVLFNETLPVDYPFVNEQVAKGKLSSIVDEIAAEYSTEQVAATLDALKDLGFTRAPWSGVTMAFSDIVAPENHEEIVAEYEEQARKVNDQYDMGLLTDEERRQELINLWTECTDKVADAMRDNFYEDNNVNIMVQSGARGNWMQVRQIAGMRGLVANPKGEIIPRPVKSNYRDGLSVLEYFISQHGARKGLADTALRTAESGYLTRRLVDVSQDVIVRDEDCGTTRGLMMQVAERDEDGNLVLVKNADGGPYSRILSKDVIDPADGATVLYKRGDALSMEVLRDLVAHGVEEVEARSVLTCQSERGVCAKCYGWSLATNQLVDIGEAVGIVAAQSIGEPGTQLTLRSFHSGGVASASDITQGLPRVAELFEARTPRGEAPITDYSGTLHVEDTDRGREVTLSPDANDVEPIVYKVSKRSPLLIKNGEHYGAGTQLIEGSVDPKRILHILGPRKAQVNIVEEVHNVYRSQGVDIHDKHIEVIVHQMLRRYVITDAGDTAFLPGELVEQQRFLKINKKTVSEGGKPAAARPELMGITKASLATESWLSAASFQETTRVLTEAALSQKVDDLKGLKENVIIGKLIPAGTGLARYRNAQVEPDKAIRDTIYPSFGLGDDTDLSNMSDVDFADVDFSNLDLGDFSLGDDFNPDDFLNDLGGQTDLGDLPGFGTDTQAE